MPGGRPGRSGGHNRIAVAEHVLRGTFNATRHTPQLPPGPSWQPESAVLEALGADGLALVGRLRASYPLSPIEGELVLEAGHAADRLAELRAHRRQASPKERLRLDRVEVTWQDAVSRILKTLRARVMSAAPEVAPKASKWGKEL
jgi:hypothetical protein